ncbi:hypothetical protein [Devosia sp. CN2-171]|jgi:hypothetical protein|uniref:hypothetical protein n=1 Tax=Devosia sp. CN2-171 TaxID=3400909 RepID=UPI003BF85DFC
MSHLAARLFKQLFERATRDKSERVVRAEASAPPALSSATVVTGHRSARVVSLLLTLEALRAAPELIDGTR